MTEKKPKIKKKMIRVVGYKNKPISHIPEQKNLLHSGKPKKKEMYKYLNLSRIDILNLIAH